MAIEPFTGASRMTHTIVFDRKVGVNGGELYDLTAETLENYIPIDYEMFRVTKMSIDLTTAENVLTTEGYVEVAYVADPLRMLNDADWSRCEYYQRASSLSTLRLDIPVNQHWRYSCRTTTNPRFSSHGSVGIRGKRWAPGHDHINFMARFQIIVEGAITTLLRSVAELPIASIIYYVPIEFPFTSHGIVFGQNRSVIVTVQLGKRLDPKGKYRWETDSPLTLICTWEYLVTSGAGDTTSTLYVTNEVSTSGTITEFAPLAEGEVDDTQYCKIDFESRILLDNPGWRIRPDANELKLVSVEPNNGDHRNVKNIMTITGTN